MEQAGVAVLRPGQVALRRRRALVRRVGLAADEQHAVGEAALVQRLGAGGAGRAAADDQRADAAVSHRRRSGDEQLRDVLLEPRIEHDAAPRRRPR